MITIIYGPPRKGKTSYMTTLANKIAFDRSRTRVMQDEVMQMLENGFKVSIPEHCVFSNYPIRLKKFRYTDKQSYIINPFRLGFYNNEVETHFIPPYSAIFITEAQKYLNSRMAMYYPDWQSRWYEQHGHFNLDIYLDVQRPMLIDPNIRDLANFIEIVDLDESYDSFGKVSKMRWVIRKIDNSSLWEKYMNSGKTDKSCYTEEVVEYDGNVFNSYDSFSCKPKFYDGHFEEDFSLNTTTESDGSIASIIKTLEENDDELPQGFYQKRSMRSA